MTRLRLRADSVDLIDARSDQSRVETLAAMGYSHYAGMVLRSDRSIRQGAETMHMLAELTDSPGMPTWLIRSPEMARRIHPVLRLGRRLLLRPLGRSLIGK